MHYLYLLLTGWALSATALAQDTLEFDPLTVTAPTWIADDDYNPRPVATIAGARLRDLYYGQEPAVLLTRTPSVTAYSDAGSPFGYAYLRLRGIDQTRLNFTLDGVPLSEPEDQGFFFNNWPDLLSSVRAIQVQPGVNVGVSGTTAFAGSVHMLSPSLGGEDYTEVSAGGGSFGGYRVSAAGQRTTAGAWTHYARATALGSNGYKRHSNHDGQSLFLQTGRVGETDLLKFTFFGGHQENNMAWLGVPDSILREDPRANYNAENERDRFLTTLTKAQYTRFISPTTTWNTHVYYGFQDGNYDFDLDNFLEQERAFGILNYALTYHTLGVQSDLEAKLGRWQYEGGVHTQRHSRRHIGSEKDVVQLYENTGRKIDLSAFSALSRNWGAFDVRAAGQLRHVNFAYDGSVDLPVQAFTFANVELTAHYTLGPAQVYYRFGHTGREPTRNDLFGGEDELLATDDGDPLLGVTEPEFVFDHELGVKSSAGDLRYGVNFFYLDFEDEITLNGAFGPNGLPLRSTVASSYRTGIEVMLENTFNDHISAGFNATYMRSRIEQDGQEFEHVLTPDVTINPTLTYRRGSWFVGLDGRYQCESFIDLANENKIDDFVTADLRVGIEKGRFSLTGYLFNIGDAEYSTNGQLNIFGRPTFHRQAGRNAWATLAYKW